MTPAEAEAKAEAKIEELFGARIAKEVPEVAGAALAAEIRARVAHAGYTRYALLDRGSYDVCAAPDEPAVLGALAALATKETGRTLHVAEVRVLRLRAGDYLLAHHDVLRADNPVEVMLDLSPRGVPGAEVHYRRRGQVFFACGGTPGAAAIVERGPSTSCNHTYVSRQYPDAEIVRLIALLTDVKA